ncbi:MAG: hypothetical protein H0X51_07610 [Parachlamydiaceae bacterium]|nr:hypothetical protein [Parachlamydiaceae bacterium]
MKISRQILSFFFLVMMIQQESHAAPPSPLYGVTIDNISNIDAVVASLANLPVKPTARIVFDTDMPAEHYKDVAEKIHAVSYVMGEIQDSCAFAKYSVDQYRARTQDYLDTLSDYVDIWEIGNEVNGEWLGNIKDVRKKLIAAYRLAKKQKEPIALTLYYNEGCTDRPQHEMFAWAEKELPTHMKENLDYVFISYYPDDCPNTDPDWQQVFTRLHKLFPHAKIGFGEAGTAYDSEKADKIKSTYSQRITVPNYVGGYFWWYFVQDMVPHTKELWAVLADAMTAQKQALMIPGEESYPAIANVMKDTLWNLSKSYRPFRFRTAHTAEDSAKVARMKVNHCTSGAIPTTETPPH